jgi:hypothetical protein
MDGAEALVPTSTVTEMYVPGDGNCFYHSLVMAYYLLEEPTSESKKLAMQLRCVVIEYIREIWSKQTDADLIQACLTQLDAELYHRVCG